jgi:Ca2+-binding RTX toxin-like protein
VRRARDVIIIVATLGAIAVPTLAHGIFAGTAGARQECTISGTAADDNLNGTTRDDVICGKAGDDSISGLEGNDVIRGGQGNDGGGEAPGPQPTPAPMRGTVMHLVNEFGLSGGDGSDTIKGQADDDSLEGNGQNDHLAGGQGDDCLGASCTVFPPFATEPGDDTLKSRDHVTGNDYVDGGDNTDTCRIDAGDEVHNCEQ